MSKTNEELQSRVAELEKEVVELRANGGKKESSTSTKLRDSADTVVDVAMNLFRSSVDAQLELLRTASNVVRSTAEKAQDEIRKRDDETATETTSRIPTSILKVAAEAIGDYSEATDRAVERFSESFKENRREYKKK